MSAQPEISQRDLRTKSKEIMDAVEGGQAFTVTRDGREIGELVPVRRRRRFVPRGEFAAMSQKAPAVDLAAFRADQDAAADHDAGAADG
ncbi:MAG: type II toxin-antitoxin system prevent-host-death family antitoxin [Streptosporangiales bacterium]